METQYYLNFLILCCKYSWIDEVLKSQESACVFEWSYFRKRRMPRSWSRCLNSGHKETPLTEAANLRNAKGEYAIVGRVRSEVLCWSWIKQGPGRGWTSPLLRMFSCPTGRRTNAASGRHSTSLPNSELNSMFSAKFNQFQFERWSDWQVSIFSRLVSQAGEPNLR